MHYHVTDGITDPGFETLNQAIHYMGTRLVETNMIPNDEERNHRSVIRSLCIEQDLHRTPNRTVSLDLPNFEELVIRSCGLDEHLIIFDLQTLGFAV